MIILRRCAAQRGARLALAAGADRHDLVRRQITVGIRRAEILHAIKIAGFTRHLHQTFHRAADNDNLQVAGRRSVVRPPP